MAEGSANKVSISDRDKKVLYIVAGIVIVALAYFLGFQKMSAARQGYVDENVTLEGEVNKLTQMVSQKATIEGQTQEYRDQTEKTLVKYPPEMRTQDVIYQLDLLEKDLKDLVLETESFTMNQVFFMNGTLTEGEVVQDVETTPASDAEGESDTPEEIVGYKSNVSTNYVTDYDSLIRIIDFVNNNTNRMTINNITVSQSEGAKELTCNMDLNMYAVAGSGKEYNPPDVGTSRVGKESLFAEGK